MKYIISVSGKLGVGKNWYISNVIIPVLEKISNKRYLEISFADQIKINAMTKNNISYHDVYEEKSQESRQLLQKEGTDIGRKLDVNIWVNYMANWITVHNKRNIEFFIISDCRFMNEYNFVKINQGITIKINSPTRNYKRLMQESNGNLNILEKISNHKSECDLDNLTNEQFDLFIDNDKNINLNIQEVQTELIVLQNQFKEIFSTKFF